METKKVLEKDIQRAVCDQLFAQKFFFWRSNNIPVFGKSNDGKTRFRALPKYTPKGLPDVIILHKGNFIALEIKRPGAALRPEQVIFKENCGLNGGMYAVITSLDDLDLVINTIK